MILPTAYFSTSLANRQRTPIYRLAIEGLTTEYATHNLKANYSEIVLADTPAGYWRLNEKVTSPVTTAATDESGNSNTGTYTNGPSLGQTGALTKDANTAVSFDGTDDYVAVPDSASLSMTSIVTVEAWIKPTNITGTQSIAVKGKAGVQFDYGLVMVTGEIGLRWNSADRVTTSVVITAGVWTHVVIVANDSAGTLLVYINGVLYTGSFTGSLTGDFIKDSAQPLWIGASQSLTGVTQDRFTGLIDEVAVYSSALSATRIQAHYDAGLMLYNRASVSRYLQLPRPITSQYTQDKGLASIGGMTLTLTDKNLDITNLIGQGIGAKNATLSAGFDDIREADYIDFPGVVADFDLGSDEASFDIKIQDAQNFLNTDIFEVSTTDLTSDITSSETATMHVTDTTNFLSAGYLILENEIIKYTGKTSNTFTTLTRAQNGTTAAAHVTGIAVREVLHLGPDHPIDLVIDCATNTDKTGASMDSSLVDSSGLATLKTSIGSTYQVEFWITERQNAMDFITRELLAIISCRPAVRNGKFTAVEFTAPTDAASVQTITDDVVCVDRNGKPVIEWGGNFQYLVNKITYNYDWDPVTQTFASHAEGSDETSIGTFGTVPTSIDSLGLRASLTGTATLISDRITALLERYSGSAPIINVRTFLQLMLIEAGDIVQLTTSFLPNRFTKTRGLTSGLFEVVQKNMAFDQGYIDWQLLYTGFGIPGTDDFDRADVTFDADITLNTSPQAWEGDSGTTDYPAIVSHQLKLGIDIGPGTARNFLMRYHGFFPAAANQTSQLEFVSASGGKAGPAVRMSGGTGAATCYAAVYDPSGPTVDLRKYLSAAISAGSSLGTYSGSLAATDRLRIHVHGTTLNVYLNDTLIIGPITDTSIPSGQPGCVHAQNSGNMTWDNWRGGDDGWA